MKNRVTFASSFFLKVIFAVSLFVLIFISVISYKHTVTLSDSMEQVIRSHKVHLELEQLISDIKDAESGQRGFIISRDTSFLKPYYDAHKKVNQAFYSLKTITLDNVQQQNNLDSLYLLINLRFTILTNSLALSTYEPASAEELDASLISGKNIMDIIRIHINKIIILENQYLSEYKTKYKSEISFTPVITLILLLFSLTVFIFSYLKINKNLETLKKSNEKLLITSESIKHAEKIGAFSSWNWDLQSNRLTYSDNQYHLLNCEPESFEPTIEKFLEFVHPDDRHLIQDGALQMASDEKPSSVAFRIIRQDGEMRYFKSIGKLLTDNSGKKTLIGINRDVTESYLNNLALEERNQSLEQSNKELASFNHIASHDLQEPLRKIQTFISRISEKEMASMSEAAKDYFARIQTSANRMRILIDDLLLFSRTNRIEKVFEKTDLNFLLENAKQELAQQIEEKKAVIQSVQLPAMHVIPFQIQQLFINLIGNSLKYSKPGIVPEIKIECEKITSKDFPKLKADSQKKYYKISISDNGLGFEQQYAEYIFLLFHRLNHLTEYPGTGIGLAICKKIIENHSGYIFAEGTPDSGSTFTFFLPR